jgi:hypothetical protein
MISCPPATVTFCTVRPSAIVTSNGLGTHMSLREAAHNLGETLRQLGSPARSDEQASRREYSDPEPHAAGDSHPQTMTQSGYRAGVSGRHFHSDIGKGLRQHDPVDLSRADVIAALRRYLHGEWSASDLSRWADEVENPERVEYEDGYSTLIASVLFDLGTPEINGEPTPERVRMWVAELDAAVP